MLVKFKKSYDNYTLQVLRNGTSNIACKKCSINNISSNAKNKQENSHIQYYNKFLNGCNKHNLEPITQSFIGYNKNYEFKCNIHGIIKSRLEYIDIHISLVIYAEFISLIVSISPVVKRVAL